MISMMFNNNKSFSRFIDAKSQLFINQSLLSDSLLIFKYS